MNHRAILFIASLPILLAVTGCDILNKNDEDKNPIESNPTYTASDVIGTWTLTEEATGMIFKGKLVFSASDFTYTQMIYAQAESTQVWNVTGTWILTDDKVMLSKETCIYFGAPGNCNDLDDYAQFVNGLLRFENGDFVKE